MWKFEIFHDRSPHSAGSEIFLELEKKIVDVMKNKKVFLKKKI